MGRNNGKSIRISKKMASRIPFREADRKTSIIQGTDGRYIRMYRLQEVETEAVQDYDATAIGQALEKLFNALPQGVYFQFVVHNRLTEGDEGMKRYLLDPMRTELRYRGYAQMYNRTVSENMEIGHNNMHKDIYYVLSVRAESFKGAAKKFQRMEPVLQERFDELQGLEAEALPLQSCLYVLYTMFHPAEDRFGEQIDLEGTGKIDLKNLKYMRMDNKDLVAPSNWNTSRKWVDHSILNEGTSGQSYARALFVHMLPRDVSASFIGDLTGVSSQMLFSIIYEPLDTELGFREASEHVLANTEIIRKSLRDTLAERKMRAKANIEEERFLNEDTYFDAASLRLFKTAKARGSMSFACTITIVLYASDLETLDKDTQLLYLSAAKFSGNVQTLDLQQQEGFLTSLPLCHRFVDCTRMIDVKRLTALSPVGVQEALKKNGMFCGLNSINDCLVMLNRRNNTELSGMITGSDHPGKTYQMKREIFNALIGTKDQLHIITMGGEYDALVKSLSGEIREFVMTKIHEMERGYGLLTPDAAFKDLFLEALKMASDLPIPLGQEDGEAMSTESRLVLHHVRNAGEMLMILDALWNKALRDKHSGRENQIFIDAADMLIALPEASEYFESLLVKCSQFQTVVTFVIDNSVRLFSNPESAIALERVTRQCGYVKLLNLGPIERKRYAEILNLPDALLPYISNVEPGKGIIVTPASNIAFNDNFHELYPDGAFKDLFARQVKQVCMQ